MAAERRLRNLGSNAVPRRAAERHYLGVVTAEARRLASQLRAPWPSRVPEARRSALAEHPDVPH